jgi:hypothetical protein
VPTKSHTGPTTAAPAAPAIRVIPPDAVFWLGELREILGLPLTTLRREARSHRLRVARRGGRYITTGAWVHEWIISGEVVRRPAERNGEAAHGCCPPPP